MSAAATDAVLHSCICCNLLRFCLTGTKRPYSDEDDADYADGSHGDSGHVTTMAQMQEVYGEFATSLTERVKRRRNHQPSYRDDEASDTETQPPGSSTKIDEINSESSNASFLEGLIFSLLFYVLTVGLWVEFHGCKLVY
jgi:hypothetical protein